MGKKDNREEKLINVDVEDIRDTFIECNEKYFDNSLPMCEFGRFRRYCGDHSFGCFLMKDGKAEIRINISRYVSWTETTFRNAVIHEMLHYHIRLNYGKIGRFLGARFHHCWPFATEIWRLNRKYGLDMPILFKLKFRNKK